MEELVGFEVLDEEVAQLQPVVVVVVLVGRVRFHGYVFLLYCRRASK
jgi:hypothetical protein